MEVDIREVIRMSLEDMVVINTTETSRTTVEDTTDTAPKKKGKKAPSPPANAAYHVVDIFACSLDQVGLLEMSRLVEATPASYTVWLCQQLGSAPADVQIWAPSERTLWLRDRPAATIRNFDFEAWELFVQRKREEAAAVYSSPLYMYSSPPSEYTPNQRARARFGCPRARLARATREIRRARGRDVQSNQTYYVSLPPGGGRGCTKSKSTCGGNITIL